MRVARAVVLDAEQQQTLGHFSRALSLPVRVVQRSSIVLLAAAGKQDKEIASELRITPKKVARWRDRFLRKGVRGICKDAPRPGRKPAIDASMIESIVARRPWRNLPSHALEHAQHGAVCGNKRGQRATDLARSRVEAPFG